MIPLRFRKLKRNLNYLLPTFPNMLSEFFFVLDINTFSITGAVSITCDDGYTSTGCVVLVLNLAFAYLNVTLICLRATFSTFLLTLRRSQTVFFGLLLCG